MTNVQFVLFLYLIIYNPLRWPNPLHGMITQKTRIVRKENAETVARLSDSFTWFVHRFFCGIERHKWHHIILHNRMDAVAAGSNEQKLEQIKLHVCVHNWWEVLGLFRPIICFCFLLFRSCSIQQQKKEYSLFRPQFYYDNDSHTDLMLMEWFFLLSFSLLCSPICVLFVCLFIWLFFPQFSLASIENDTLAHTVRTLSFRTIFLIFYISTRLHSIRFDFIHFMSTKLLMVMLHFQRSRISLHWK